MHIVCFFIYLFLSEEIISTYFCHKETETSRRTANTGASHWQKVGDTQPETQRDEHATYNS